MKLLKIAAALMMALLATAPVYGKMGATKKQNAERYGAPVETSTNPAGYNILSYDKGKFHVVCTYDKQGVCRMVLYKVNPITIDMVIKVLGLNLPQYAGDDWKVTEEDGSAFMAVTPDKKYLVVSTPDKGFFFIADAKFLERVSAEVNNAKLKDLE